MGGQLAKFGLATAGYVATAGSLISLVLLAATLPPEAPAREADEQAQEAVQVDTGARGLFGYVETHKLSPIAADPRVAWWMRFPALAVRSRELSVLLLLKVLLALALALVHAQLSFFAQDVLQATPADLGLYMSLQGM